MATTNNLPLITLPGFSRADKPAPRRIILSVDGLEGKGKTHFALSAPGPIAYFDFDIGAEDVLPKYQDVKLILTADEPFRVPSDNREETVTQAAAEKEYARFEKAYRAAIASGVRTVIIDTATEAWDLLRYAELGKLNQVKPHHYTKVNSIYRNLIRSAYDQGANVLLLHKLKAEWKENSEGKARKTGTYERAGFSETGFLVQAEVRCWREVQSERAKGEESDGWRLTVGKCRQNPQLDGYTFENDGISFTQLAMMMLPETREADWADTAARVR